MNSDSNSRKRNGEAAGMEQPHRSHISKETEMESIGKMKDENSQQQMRGQNNEPLSLSSEQLQQQQMLSQHHFVTMDQQPVVHTSMDVNQSLAAAKYGNMSHSMMNVVRGGFALPATIPGMRSTWPMGIAQSLPGLPQQVQFLQLPHQQMMEAPQPILQQSQSLHSLAFDQSQRQQQQQQQRQQLVGMAMLHQQTPIQSYQMNADTSESLNSTKRPGHYHDYAREAEEGAASVANQNVPLLSFVDKLHYILSDDSYSDYICWLPHGRSWKILDQDAFEEKVIPHFFRHSKCASFMRQVNGWGFRRIPSGPDRNSYYHEMFLRGYPNLCSEMARPVVSNDKNVRACKSHPVFTGSKALVSVPLALKKGDHDNVTSNAMVSSASNGDCSLPQISSDATCAFDTDTTQNGTSNEGSGSDRNEGSSSDQCNEGSGSDQCNEGSGSDQWSASNLLQGNLYNRTTRSEMSDMDASNLLFGLSSGTSDQGTLGGGSYPTSSRSGSDQGSGGGSDRGSSDHGGSENGSSDREGSDREGSSRNRDRKKGMNTSFNPSSRGSNEGYQGGGSERGSSGGGGTSSEHGSNSIGSCSGSDNGSQNGDQIGSNEGGYQGGGYDHGNSAGCGSSSEQGSNSEDQGGSNGGYQGSGSDRGSGEGGGSSSEHGSNSISEQGSGTDNGNCDSDHSSTGEGEHSGPDASPSARKPLRQMRCPSLDPSKS